MDDRQLVAEAVAILNDVADQLSGAADPALYERIAEFIQRAGAPLPPSLVGYKSDWAVNVEPGKITVGGKTASVPVAVATDAAHALDSQG